MIESLSWSVLIGTFVASSVEVTEMVIIVVGVGATRGWRATWFGLGAGLTVLVGIIAGLGQALQLIPIDVVRVIIGALLLTFGLQWYRQGVIGVAADGFRGGNEEEEEVSGGGSSGGLLDWTAFVLAFKGVLLEGLEVAFIVVAFGAGGAQAGTGSGATAGYGSAYIGAAGAFLVIGVLGFVAKRQVEKVPGRTLKFGVGGLLSTFGTFWALEGLGVHWPGDDLSLAWLYMLYLGSTFAMMLAVRHGLLGPVPPSALPDPGPAGPSGLAPASRESIREFQAAHGLQADGVVGPRTQAAVRAVRAERGASVDAVAVGVDAGDEEAIASIQRRLDVPVTGRLDAMTRGAVRVLQHPGIVDPLDEPAVRRFQRDHGLAENGTIDAPTRVALAAVLADAGDPVTRLRDLDPGDERTVCRFQQSLGMPASGDIDAETRGAMRALRAWLVVNPLSDEAVRQLQRQHGLQDDGVIGQRSRTLVARRRAELGRGRTSRASSEPDPYDEESVRAFQRRREIAEQGTIGPETRAAIRWEREHHLSVDPSEAAAIRRFQRDHALEPDGVLGPRTQAAMRAARSELEPTGRKEREVRYGRDPETHDGHILDPSDSADVRRFQRKHRLEDHGIIATRTQTAIDSVRRERHRPDCGDDAHDRDAREDGQ